tara:strand:- start:151 stop:840 length:690 start_codon:yes stop_codon:yes gene_type:complete
MSLSIIIPCYNEQDHIIDTLNNIKAGIVNSIFSSKFEIIIIDDGSNDQSQDLVKHYLKKNENINLHVNNINLGLGHSIFKGFNLAKNDYVIWFPGDDNLESVEISKILNSFEEDKILISIPNSKNSRTLKRRVISRLYVIILNLITGLRIPYYNSFNIYRTKITQQYNKNFFNFGFLAMMLIFCMKENHKIKFVDFNIKERLKGESNALTIKNLIEIIKLILYLIFKKN